jgi:hypothetical protein
MKYSRDAARELAASQALDSFISKEIELIKDLGASCVSLGTPYDEEFVPYLKAWVDKARSAGLSVWFRGNMSGWEGWFNYPKFTSPNQHHTGIKNFILNHPDLFRDGDIFTPAPEPENGMLGDPRFSQDNRSKFIEFLPKSYQNCADAFAQIEIGVSCGYFSFNGDVARQIMTKELIAQTGNILVVDHYVSTPEKLLSDLEDMHKKFGVPMVLGEFGGPIPDIHGAMNEQQQAEYVTALMRKLYQGRGFIQGMNYWVLRGGSTELVAGESVKPAYHSLKSYYSPVLVTGKVSDSLGRPVEGASIASGSGIHAVTAADGTYTLVLPAVDDTVQITDESWVSNDAQEISPESQKVLVKDMLADPAEPGIWYKFRRWLRNLSKN